MNKRIIEVRNTHIQKRDNLIHIETDGCVVNIRPGLYRDPEVLGGKFIKVTSIEVIPDGRDSLEPGYEWVREGEHAVRVIRLPREKK